MLLAFAVFALAEPPPPGWKVVAAADQSFEVLVPDKTSRTGTRSRTLRRGGVSARVQVTYAVTPDGLTLAAESLALGGPGLKGLATDDLYKLVADADVDDGWRVGPIKGGGAAGLPGATYTATNGTESKRVQLAGTKSRLYILSATGPADAVKGAVAEQFLTSLTPTPERAKEAAPDKPTADKPADPKPGFAKPPGKGKKPAAPAGDVPEWLTDPAKMVAPDGPVHGVIKGKPFTVEKVELRAGRLSVRSGSGFFPDAEASVFLFSNESPAGQMFLVGGRKATSGHTPHIHLKRMDPGDTLPHTDIVSSDYGLRLEFGPVRNGKIAGKLYLCCPDGGKGETSIAGKFEADWQGR